MHENTAIDSRTFESTFKHIYIELLEHVGFRKNPTRADSGFSDDMPPTTGSAQVE